MTKEKGKEKAKYYYDDFNIVEYSCAVQKYEDVLKLIIGYLRFMMQQFDVSLLSTDHESGNNNNIIICID